MEQQWDWPGRLQELHGAAVAADGAAIKVLTVSIKTQMSAKSADDPEPLVCTLEPPWKTLSDLAACEQ
jgi:hypothetical protein